MRHQGADNGATEPEHMRQRFYDASHARSFSRESLVSHWSFLPAETGHNSISQYMRSNSQQHSLRYGQPYQAQSPVVTMPAPRHKPEREVDLPHVTVYNRTTGNSAADTALARARAAQATRPVDRATQAANPSRAADKHPHSSVVNPIERARAAQSSRMPPNAQRFLTGFAVVQNGVAYPLGEVGNPDFGLPMPIPQGMLGSTLEWTMRGGHRWLKRHQRDRYWVLYDREHPPSSSSNGIRPNSTTNRDVAHGTTFTPTSSGGSRSGFY